VAAEGVCALGRKGCGGHGMVEVNWDESQLEMRVGDFYDVGLRSERKLHEITWLQPNFYVSIQECLKERTLN